jgi:hypothetical protein
MLCRIFIYTVLQNEPTVRMGANCSKESRAFRERILSDQSCGRGDFNRKALAGAT